MKNINCEKFEELLIDYIHDELGFSEMELIKRHLTKCHECSKKLDEYEEIREVFKNEPGLKPNSVVLSSLSEAAKVKIGSLNRPIWKRWFYSPILVPVLSSVIAICFWVYYGQQNVVYSPDDSFYSRDVIAKKIPLEQEPKPPTKGGMIFKESKQISERELSKPHTDSVLVSDKKTKVRISGGKSSTIVSSEEMTGRKDTTEPYPSKGNVGRREVSQDIISYGNQDEVLAVPQGKSISHPATEEIAMPEKSFKAEDNEELQSEVEKEVEIKYDKPIEERLNLYSYREYDYQKQLDLAIRQQKEGNCDASIKTNEELLKASPTPPDSLKEKSYLTLAECFEQKGEWNKAISSYDNLKKIAPGQATFADKRIERVRQKSNVFKAMDVSPAGPLDNEAK